MVHLPAIYLKNFLEENLKYNTLQIHEHIMVLIDDWLRRDKKNNYIRFKEILIYIALQFAN